VVVASTVATTTSYCTWDKNLVVPTVVRAEKLSSLCLERQDEQPPGDDNKRIKTKTDKEHFNDITLSVSFFVVIRRSLSI